MIPILIFSIHCNAQECVYLKDSEITPKNTGLYALKTALESSTPAFRVCLEKLSFTFKNHEKYRQKNPEYPITINVDKGQVSANCECRNAIHGDAERENEIKYNFEVARCYAKVVSKIKLPSSESLTKICWDGKFPVGESSKKEGPEPVGSTR